MGKHGAALGKFLGGKFGRYVGGKFGAHGAEAGHRAGEAGGEYLGGLLPFKKGGKIKKTGKAYMHKGEFVLPLGVSPTTHQIQLVKKRGGRV